MDRGRSTSISTRSTKCSSVSNARERGISRGIRVTAGNLRGRALSKLREGIRPTSARVREAYFNIVGPDLQGASFVDLFSGSGIMALEASSRGASRVIAVEKVRDHVRQIEKSAEAFGAVVETRTEDVFRFLAEKAPAVSLVYADPPWKFDRYPDLLEALADASMIGPDTLIAIESPKRIDLPSEVTGAPGRLERTDHRVWGDTALWFFRRGAAE